MRGVQVLLAVWICLLPYAHGNDKRKEFSTRFRHRFSGGRHSSGEEERESEAKDARQAAPAETQRTSANIFRSRSQFRRRFGAPPLPTATLADAAAPAESSQTVAAPSKPVLIEAPVFHSLVATPKDAVVLPPVVLPFMVTGDEMKKNKLAEILRPAPLRNLASIEVTQPSSPTRNLDLLAPTRNLDLLAPTHNLDVLHKSMIKLNPQHARTSDLEKKLEVSEEEADEGVVFKQEENNKRTFVPRRRVNVNSAANTVTKEDRTATAAISRIPTAAILPISTATKTQEPSKLSEPLTKSRIKNRARPRVNLGQRSRIRATSSSSSSTSSTSPSTSRQRTRTRTRIPDDVRNNRISSNKSAIKGPVKRKRLNIHAARSRIRQELARSNKVEATDSDSDKSVVAESEKTAPSIPKRRPGLFKRTRPQHRFSAPTPQTEQEQNKEEIMLTQDSEVNMPEKSETAEIIQTSETRKEFQPKQDFMKIEDVPVPSGVFPQTNRILLRTRHNYK